MALGLTDVSTADLRTLLRALHREELCCPLTPVGLTAVGLQEVVHALLEHLRGLERSAVHAVVVAVIAEREYAPSDARCEDAVLPGATGRSA